MIECNTKTTNFSSGRALLRYSDYDNDGKIGAADIGRAGQRMENGEITGDEYEFVVQASAEGTIDEFCPPLSQQTPPWLLIGAAILLFFLLTRG